MSNRIDDLNRTLKRCISNFKPPEKLTVSEWADKYRKLSPENSAEAGRWKTKRTPYLEEIMNAFTDPKIHRIAIAASSQLGKTECEMNMLGYAIDVDPGPIMWVMPTVDNARDFSKRRIAPMIRDTLPLRNKVAQGKSRSGDNTVLKKSYPGGMLTMTGSNSPASLASVPCRYVFGDELDRWATDAGGEGDPWGLLEARTTTFYNHKMVQVSTPTTKGNSAIEDAFDTGTQEYWSTKCPHCGEYHFITFNDIKFEKTVIKIKGKKHYNVESARYCCPDCGCISEENEIKNAPHKWISKNPDAYKNGVRSFWINTFSSPWTSWKEIVLQFLEADGNPEKLKTVFNTKLGQLWEDRGDGEDEETLYNRRENYEAELPDGVLCLTCGVDTQDNRLEYEVVGYGHYKETWGIKKGFIMGVPDTEEVWEKLDAVIDKDWSYCDGKKLRISITFVDSGGHYTQDVYEQCSKRIGKRVFAIKGKGGEGEPFTSPPSKVKIVDKNNKKKVIGKAWLYNIGVDAGKASIMAKLKVQESGAKYCHYPSNEECGYDMKYFSGLLSERMVHTSGKWKWMKIEGHERNEPLDCRNYANAAFKVLSPNMDELEKKLKNVAIVKKEKVKQTFKKQRKRTYDDGEW